MSFNVLDAVKGYLTPDLITQASSSLYESESGISKALSGIIPTVLSGFVTKANAGGRDAGDVLDIVKNSYQDGTLNKLTGFFNDNGAGPDKGLRLVQALFGDKLNSLISSIASYAGIKNSSAGSLFSIAGPLVAAVVGKQSSDLNMSASGLSSFLHGQKTNILSMLPAGLSGIAGLLGLSKLGDAVQDTVNNTARYIDETVDDTKRGTSWLLWLLLLVLLGLAIWYFAGKASNKIEPSATIPNSSTEDTVVAKPVENAANTTKAVLDSAGNFIYDVGTEKEIKLADGTILKVGEKSIEAKLFTMLSDPSFTIDTVDKTKNWIVLDRVYFETGKAILTAASQAQVKNIAAILKNFPKASIKLGGYTDNTGDAVINKSVSDARAKAVAKELIKTGAGVAQIKEATGYGPDFPVCAANNTPECRAQNRRVDLKVASK